MRKTGTYAGWTHPGLEMPAAFGRVSYALFLTGGQDGEIIASRSPDPGRLAPGNSLINVLELDGEACRFLWEDSPDPRPLFIKTRVGLGLLDKVYHRHAGLGLFLHIHGRPGALARLINHGVLGDPAGSGFRVSEAVRAKGDRVTSGDMASYAALLEAKEVLFERPWGFSHSSRRDALEPVTMAAAEVREVLGRMASFAGGHISWEEEGPSFLSCYRLPLTEAALFCMVSEVSTFAVGQAAKARISTLDGLEGGGLALHLTYSMEKPILDGELYGNLAAARSRLGVLWEPCGLGLQADVRLPRYGEKREGRLPEVTLSLEWLYDPAVLSTSDLKARLGLRRG